MSYLRTIKVIQVPSLNILPVRYCCKVQRTPETVVNRGDIIGKPNPISNIRPITFHVPQNETALEQNFRLTREQVQNWHEDFWKHHNSTFVKERKQFIEALQAEKSDNTSNHAITADEISVFYKSFLDKYWKIHINYNFEWYKKNLHLLILAFKVEIDRFRRKMF